ncbi:hypothetical protein EOB59_20380 [Mesorhizobium sp. M7A.F.Ca.MR.176.00.0.0]|uniref:hypothetical protein n=1 Tax=unclassified Mesorhizobium TaxID=325217 RepID=UPI000FD2A737|nr:hypothetical protein [Mesorhizobium sp. M7A.F.Ca.MR.176.00.0.0]RUU89022.1 hypothetical protein EOB59_20380 [Mesorhizobium sp. M7A.F.Ca.MR.176.00.0.0]
MKPVLTSALLLNVTPGGCISKLIWETGAPVLMTDAGRGLEQLDQRTASSVFQATATWKNMIGSTMRRALSNGLVAGALPQIMAGLRPGLDTRGDRHRRSRGVLIGYPTSLSLSSVQWISRLSHHAKKRRFRDTTFQVRDTGFVSRSVVLTPG